MFGGILVGIMKGMFFLGEDIKATHESSVSQSKALRNGDDTYFDASGRRRDTKTGEKVIVCYDKNMDLIKEDYHGNVLRNYSAEKRVKTSPKKYNWKATTIPLKKKVGTAYDDPYGDGYLGTHYLDKKTSQVYISRRIDMQYCGENKYHRSMTEDVYVDTKTHKAVRLTDDSILKILKCRDLDLNTFDMTKDVKEINDDAIVAYNNWAAKLGLAKMTNVDRAWESGCGFIDTYPLRTEV